MALSQHAIKHEFEYNTAKSAPHRFRAYCSRRDEDKCPWKIYALKADDSGTVMVRKNPSGTVDGHNWLFTVCLGVFDLETNENWIWFMQQLRHAIGSPRGLVICTDCG